MADLHWINCPKCGSIGGLRRLGQVGVIVKGKLQDHMKLIHSKHVKCLDCGSIFRTEGATIFEAMGRDSVGDTPY